MKNAPIPKKIKKKLVAHNDERIDWYYWLRDDERKKKEVLDYLDQENIYTKKWFKENKVESKRIFEYYRNALRKC